ncbi:inorganic pyrophosphatase [Micractinium conductrix]|uniref:inorganic diphosphatase n=1 Tax=Micractinium conductrix TaxID=554055 RepID=A0A2P6VQE6_9CHLO|nr:inorganic pyrophosphatase [Micractinium conductrix]|eukprot:PSC76323.1 inorganic pyrophosphatase [Micractinium conductrix]
MAAALAMRAALLRPQAVRLATRPLAARPRALQTSVVRAAYANEKQGPADSLEYRIFFKQQKDGAVVSPWHDIPLYAGDGLLNFICEIPKESAAKMEVATDETNTPIKQDTKKGKLRFYPYNINWNYGLLPQTWEDPAHKNAECDAAGDNDPVDVVEIGTQACDMGGVYQVKPLGVYAMIDDGELDWKVICIRADDPMAAKLNDVEDVEREMPGELEKVRTWFQDYKIPDGKGANKFGYNNKCLNKAFAVEVIEETHTFYNKLRSGARANTEELSLV